MPEELWTEVRDIVQETVIKTILKKKKCKNARPLLSAKSLQLCPTLCDPRDSSPPGSPVPGILQARTLEWVAISFSNAWKWKVKVNSLSRARLAATPWTAAYQAPPSTGLSKQEYWSGVPSPSPKASKEALKITEKRREVKSKGEKERYTHLNAEFQWISRRDKKAFLSDQCKEIEENNRMGKTRDLFKKMRDTKGTFHVKMGSIKDRNAS